MITGGLTARRTRGGGGVVVWYYDVSGIWRREEVKGKGHFSAWLG